MFTLFSIVYYEITIEKVSQLKPVIEQLIKIRKDIVESIDPKEIRELTEKSDDLYEGMINNVDILKTTFLIIEILSFLNMTFFL